MAEQAGGGRGDARPKSGGGEAERSATLLVWRPRAWFAATLPGGVGAPPGGTTASRQELADVDVRSFAAADARPWNGADTGARSQEG